MQVGRWSLRPQVQHADEGEEPPPGVMIERDLVGQAVDQERRAFVVERPSPRIDGLDLRQIVTADGVVIAFADDKVVLTMRRNGPSPT